MSFQTFDFSDICLAVANYFAEKQKNCIQLTIEEEEFVSFEKNIINLFIYPNSIVNSPPIRQFYFPFFKIILLNLKSIYIA